MIYIFIVSKLSYEWVIWNLNKIINYSFRYKLFYFSFIPSAEIGKTLTLKYEVLSICRATTIYSDFYEFNIECEWMRDQNFIWLYITNIFFNFISCFLRIKVALDLRWNLWKDPHFLWWTSHHFILFFYIFSNMKYLSRFETGINYFYGRKTLSESST